MISDASTRLSSRVPRYTPTCPVSEYPTEYVPTE